MINHFSSVFDGGLDHRFFVSRSGLMCCLCGGYMGGNGNFLEGFFL